MSGKVDWVAVRNGALASIAICMPVALISQLIVDQDADDQPPVVYLLYAAVLLGFVVGGWVAGRRAAGTPYTSGAVAALCGFVAIQAVGVIARVIDGDTIRVVLIVTNGLLAYGAGLLGAAMSSMRRKTA